MQQSGFLSGIENLSESEQAQRRNLENKRQAAIAYLGEKWVMHPKHSPSNSRTPVSMLSGAMNG